MGIEESRPIERATIVLHGGGRLENVAEVLDVRLEADPLKCDLDGPNRILVKGGVRAYVYCRNTRGRDVAGQGFYIPFSSRIGVGSIPVQHADVALGELRSDHTYDPITGEFQHQITVELTVSDRRSPGTNKQSDEQERPSDRAKGETRISQVRTGSSPEKEVGIDEPVATRKPTPEEYHDLYGSINHTDPSTIDQADKGQENVNEERVSSRVSPQPQSQPDAPAKKKGPIVWGPFPPPIG